MMTSKVWSSALLKKAEDLAEIYDANTTNVLGRLELNLITFLWIYEEFKNACEAKYKKPVVEFEGNARTVIVGPFEGSLTTLCGIIKTFHPNGSTRRDASENTRFLFLGNFIGSGNDVAAIAILMAWKAMDPDNVLLIAGTNEFDVSLWEKIGFVKRVKNFYDQNVSMELETSFAGVINSLKQLREFLQIAVINDGSIFMHGCVPSNMAKFEQMRMWDFAKGITTDAAKLATNYLYSVPSDDTETTVAKSQTGTTIIKVGFTDLQKALSGKYQRLFLANPYKSGYTVIDGLPVYMLYSRATEDQRAIHCFELDRKYNLFGVWDLPIKLGNAMRRNVTTFSFDFAPKVKKLLFRKPNPETRRALQEIPKKVFSEEKKKEIMELLEKLKVIISEI